MSSITDVVLEYLNLNTNNALVITGDYGIGKTYFFKTQLTQRINETATSSDASKKYKTIHISLFGIKSVEDLQTQIFISIYPYLRNKAVKLTIGLTKSLARGLVNITKLGNIDDYIADIQTTSHNLLSYGDLVLCFDDLERKSESFSLLEIFGFINSIVENENAKVIIITNEDKLDNEYKNLIKEKVIGNTVHFIPSVEQTFNDIITKRYKSTFTSYYQFLLANQSLILKSLAIANNNFRTLIFFCEYFIKSIQEKKKENSSIEKDKLENILFFSLAIAIEYKKGKISFLKKENLDSNFRSMSLSDMDFNKAKISNETEEADPFQYKNDFLSIYDYSANSYHFYDSIFNYITGGSGFNFYLLEKELDDAYFTNEVVASEREEILQKLDYRNYFKLNDREYSNYTYRMLQYVDKGEYPLVNYVPAFYFATRFDNMLNFDVSGLILRFKKGIKKGVRRYEYDDNLDMKIYLSKGEPYYEAVHEIATECLLINTNLKKNLQIVSANELFILLGTDLEQFINKAEDRSSEYILKPIFYNFQTKKTVKIIYSFNIEHLLKFSLYLKKRYSHGLNEYYYLDREFFEFLKIKLQPDTKVRKVKNLRNEHLNNLLQSVEQVLKNLKEYS